MAGAEVRPDIRPVQGSMQAPAALVVWSSRLRIDQGWIDAKSGRGIDKHLADKNLA